MERKVLSNCWDCKNETNHKLLFSYRQQSDSLDENNKVYETELNDYNVVECLGCNNISFVLITRLKSENGKPNIIKEVFPYDSKYLNEEDTVFLTFEESTALPLLVRNLYSEIEDIFPLNNPILTGIGLRTLLEAVCIHQNIKGRNLKDKIDNLHKNGLIAAKDLPILHNLREIGNVTVHQIKKPSEKTLHYSLEILNHTLKSLYVIPRFHSKIVKK